TSRGPTLSGPAGSYTWSSGATGPTPVTSGTVTLSAGAATQLVLTTQASTAASSGVPLAQQPVVQLQDANGNAVSQSSVVVTATASPTGATASSNTATTGTAGAAMFSGLMLSGTVGSYTLSFGATNLTPDSVASGYTLQPTATGLAAAASNPFNVAVPLVAPVLLSGAGDIAEAGGKQAATATLLDAIPGTVFAAGDQAYPDGALSQYQTLYDPAWGRHKARTRPAPGNHDYVTPGAPGYFAYFGVA